MLDLYNESYKIIQRKIKENRKMENFTIVKTQLYYDATSP